MSVNDTLINDTSLSERVSAESY